MILLLASCKLSVCKAAWCHQLCEPSLPQPPSVLLPPQVMWLPDTERQLVRQIAPGFQQTSGLKLDAEHLREKGIVKLNLRYTKVTNEDVRYRSPFGRRVIACVLHSRCPWLCVSLCPACTLAQHSITESLRLEKTSKITKSNCQLNTTMPAKPCPQVQYLHTF